MINGITQGIIDALAAAFPGVILYTEKVPQNFAEPSFRVKRLTVTNRSGLDTRKYRQAQYDVLYFPASQSEPETEWNTVAEKLFQSLEWITADGDTIRGEDMSADFDAEQSAGHFRVTYGAFLLDKIEPGPKMETAEHVCKP